jgi:hypothetical protein
MRKELLIGDFNVVVVVRKKGGDVTFRVGLTIVCLFRTYVSPLSLSAVSSHVLVSLLILGPV